MLWRRLYSVASASASRQNLKSLVPPVKDFASKLPATQSTAAKNLSIEALMASGVHLGHTTKIWHKNMLPFIYGRRSGIHVINLEHTLTYLQRAMTITREIASKGGIIIFVGSRDFMQDILLDSAKRSNQFYVYPKWLRGCLLNHKLALKSASVEGWMLQPDLIICLDMMENRECLEEAASARVPTIGLCDTDCDPMAVTYPVPGNDDSHASVDIVARLLTEAAVEGRKERDAKIVSRITNNKQK